MYTQANITISSEGSLM